MYRDYANITCRYTAVVRQKYKIKDLKKRRIRKKEWWETKRDYRHLYIAFVRKILNATTTVRMTYCVDVGGERTRDVIEYYISKSCSPRRRWDFRPEIGKRTDSGCTGKMVHIYNIFIYYVGRLPQPYHRSRPVYFPIDCLGGNLYARPLCSIRRIDDVPTSLYIYIIHTYIYIIFSNNNWSLRDLIRISL